MLHENFLSLTARRLIELNRLWIEEVEEARGSGRVDLHIQVWYVQ